MIINTSNYDADGNLISEEEREVPDEESDGADEPITLYQDERGRWVWCFSLKGEYDVRARRGPCIVDFEPVEFEGEND